MALASVEDARAVIDAAAAAFPAWRDTSLAKRTAILFNFRELLNARKGELAEIITSEHGKVVSDALGEVSRGQEVVEFACGIPHLLKGGFTENASTKVDVYSIRQPLGPVGIISPFNFPAMVPMWFFPIAIAAGNTVVLKPSEKDPSASLWLARAVGRGRPAARGVQRAAGRQDRRRRTADQPQDQVGVLRRLHPDRAVRLRHRHRARQARAGPRRGQEPRGDPARRRPGPGRRRDGQRRLRLGRANAAWPSRRVWRSGRSPTTWSPRSPNAPATIKTGDGTGDADMGPLVTKAHRDKVASYIDAGEADGAKIVVDGRNVTADGGKDGFWLGPTLIDNVTPEMSVYTDEIFGPVLSVVRVESYDEALELINANPYGNGTAIFTNDGGAARRFQNEVEVGMVGINVPIPVPMAYYSFGGWKASLFGDTHAHGTDGVQFFTRGKAITSRWLDPSHGGIELGFPQNN